MLRPRSLHMFLTLRKPQLLALLALLSILGCSHTTTNSVSGTVVKIADGDTITILDSQNVQHKIRLQGIDAPERRQDFGTVSREHLGSLVFGKLVRIEYEKTDGHGRLVGKVWVDGNDECLEQLKAGLAWHYKEYEKEQSPADRQLYATAEQEARSQKRGLWKDPSPTPPWEYRHHTNGSTGETDSSDERISDERNIGSTPIKTASPVVERAFPSLPLADHSPGTVRTPVAHSNTGRVQSNFSSAESALIRGNRRSMIYHWPGCRNYDDIALHNRVPFRTREDAERAGYRAASNCN
jgi:endonuclease YncB( thermonuclease family)